MKGVNVFLCSSLEQTVKTVCDTNSKHHTNYYKIKETPFLSRRISSYTENNLHSIPQFSLK